MNNDDGSMNGVFSAVRAALIAIGGALVTGDVITVKSPVYFWIMFLSGSIMVIGPAIWGVVVQVQHVLKVRQERAKGVQAGINLVIAGQALTVAGKPIPGGTGDGEPLPVTEKTAAEIVKNFAPASVPKAA